jgi:single-strand selective monofunctional uracil DNA glycosylase
MKPVSIARRLVRDLEGQEFAAPVTHVYNPLVHAAKPHRLYLERYAEGPKEILLLGMNPGPFGMAQTGVPFGDVSMVRDWLGIEAAVGKPEQEHPKRPILGFDCPRSEVSGTRLWGWARESFGTPERFFQRFFVWNYCPLIFLEESGRNRTPDKLAKTERDTLFQACDAALVRMLDQLQPRYAIGVGKFAEGRLRAVIDDESITIGAIPHPSPANPQANKGWAKAAGAALAQMGIKV